MYVRMSVYHVCIIVYIYIHTHTHTHIHRYAALEGFVMWGLGAGLGPGYPVDLHSFWHSQ